MDRSKMILVNACSACNALIYDRIAVTGADENVRILRAIKSLLVRHKLNRNISKYVGEILDDLVLCVESKMYDAYLPSGEMEPFYAKKIEDIDLAIEHFYPRNILCIGDDASIPF